jgi:hypothetical protein
MGGRGGCCSLLTWMSLSTASLQTPVMRTVERMLVETRLSGFLVPRAGKNGQAWIFLKLGIAESQLTEKKD